MEKHRLKNLRVTKVDFVDAGANQRANIVIRKGAGEGGGTALDRLLSAFAEKINAACKALTDSLGKPVGKKPEDEPIPDEPEEKAKTKADEPPKQTKKSHAGGIYPRPDPPSPPPPIDNKLTKGEEHEMKIDKSKMTAEELKFLDGLEKKYGTQEEAAPEPTAKAEPKQDAAPEPTEKAAPKTPEEVLKEFAPQLATLMEGVEKRLQAQEDAAIMEVAKRYELLGQKPEELAPTLKSVKAASEDAYGMAIALLDKSLDIAKKSGLFDEIGKDGHGAADSSAVIEKRAREILTENPKLSVYEARDQAFRENPELIKDFE